MHHLILLFFLSLSTIVEAQQVGDLFKAMPPELLPGVSEGNKTMLLVDSGKTTVPYPLGEIVKEAYGNDYLRLQTSKIGTLQLKLLPVSEDSVVVCLIKTVCGNVCDSHISFYTSEWKKLGKEAFLPTISAEIFLNSSQKKSENDKYAVSLPDIYPISATFNETGTDLTLTFHYKERLAEEQIQQLEPLLKGDSLVLTWKNGSFR
ncbi:MAG: DUF3256 family protein [Proteiniphilum sp.]|jgi:hypothetical protein|nr:DUF3256 family protein [Proteiniphilum sp.]MDD4452228.1 DUF3256 family protein [Proteiniphilum sp.]